MNLSNQQTFIMVEKHELEEIVKNALQEMIPNIGQNNVKETNSVGDYIPQSEVMKILNRKVTWFHLKRKSGELPATKSGNQWWYLKTDIEDFVKNGKVSNF